MFNLIRADLYKLRKSTSIKILLGITTLSAILMAIMAYLIPQGKIEASKAGIGFIFSDINVISILGAVVTGIIISSDFDNKTIHNAIASGCSRVAVIMSKAAVLSLTIALILLPYAIVTWIALGSGNEFSMGSVAVGFLHTLTSEAGTAFSASDIWKLLGITLTLITLYVAQVSICIPLAFMLKKPVLIIPIYYGFTILCAQLMGSSGGASLFDRIFSVTPYGGDYAFMTLDTDIGMLLQALAVSLVFIIVMVAIVYGAFRRTEIK
ncbi:ABC transporter permease [Paenibacillus marinisediminis]